MFTPRTTIAEQTMECIGERKISSCGRNRLSAEGVPSSEIKIRTRCTTLSLASRRMLSIGELEIHQSAPSPFLLEGVIEAHLGTWEKQEPEVVEKIRRELYIDDLISGSTSVCKAQKLKEQATAIFQDAGFTLHKWHSNAPELQSAQNKVDDPTYAKQQVAIPEGENCGLLGLGWNKRRDTVSVAIPSEKTAVTKRGLPKSMIPWDWCPRSRSVAR